MTRHLSGNSIKNLQKIGPYLREDWHLVLGALLSLIIAALCVLAIGSGVRFLVDNGLSTQNETVMDKALLVLFCIITALALASFLRSTCVSLLGERVIMKFRQGVYNNLLNLDPGFYEQNNTGEIISRLTSDTTLVQSVISSTLPMAMRNSILLLGGIAMLLITSPKLTLMVILVVPVILLPIVLMGRRVRRLSKDSRDSVGEIGAYVDETLHGIQTIQSFVKEDFVSSRYKEKTYAAYKTASQHIMNRSFMAAAVIFIVFSCVGIVLWIGGHDVIAGRMTPGALTSFVFYAVLVASSAGTLSEVYGSLNQASGAADRLISLLNEQSHSPLLVERHQAAVIPIFETLSFENIKFSYPKKPDIYALNDINFTINRGETVAFVGPSGSGKTTLVKLMLRFYEPQDGIITLDDTNVKSLDIKPYRSLFSVVPQDTVIFSDTIRNNILLAKPDASEDEVIWVTKMANAYEFIEELPDGIDTLVGEGGSRLSGGQKQRISIARALLNNPAFLLLDEATSSLDSISEKAVQDMIQNKTQDQTKIIIAHRLSTVMIADTIYVMDKGRIVNFGNHQELLKTTPLYKNLIESQVIGGAKASAIH